MRAGLKIITGHDWIILLLLFSSRAFFYDYFAQYLFSIPKRVTGIMTPPWFFFATFDSFLSGKLFFEPISKSRFWDRKICSPEKIRWRRLSAPPRIRRFDAEVAKPVSCHRASRMKPSCYLLMICQTGENTNHIRSKLTKSISSFCT